MKKDIKEFIPIAILDILGIFAIFETLTTDYDFTYKQFVGIPLVFICTALFFLNKRVYRYFLGFVLVAGAINIIAFTLTITTIGGFLFGLEFQLIPFLLLIYYIYIFKTGILKLFKTTDSEKQNNSESLKDRFKQKFEKLADKEIEIKLNQKLVPEAILALEEIQAERK